MPKTLLQFSGHRNPGPTEEGITTRAEEQERGPSAAAVPVAGLEAHVHTLGQGSPSHGVLLLHSSPPRLGRRRRQGSRERRREPAAASREEEEDEREDQRVDKNERGP